MERPVRPDWDGHGRRRGCSEDKRMLRLELAAWRSTVRFMDAVELVGVSE